MITLTYWEDPPNKKNLDDFDGINTIRLKSVKEIPSLVEKRPPNCTMISTEHSAERILKNGRKTNFFKVIWQGPRGKRTTCPYCHGRGKI